jgi:hypothetical protein
MAQQRVIAIRMKMLARSAALVKIVLACAGGFGRESCAQMIPRVIKPQDLPAMCEQLRLSEAQAHALGEMHEHWSAAFQAQFGEGLRDAIQAREAFINAIARPDKVPSEQPIVVMQRETMARIERLRQTIDSRNERFYQQLSAILTPEQQARLPRVRLNQERLEYGRGLISIRERNADVMALIGRLPVLAPDEIIALDQAIDEMLPAYVANLREAERAEDKATALKAEVADIARPYALGDITQPDEIRNRIESLYRDWGRLVLPPSEKVVEASRRMVERFAIILSPANAAELRRLYNETSYPEVWPDPGRADRLFTAAARLENLTKDQSEAIALFRAQYEEQHGRLSDLMAKVLYRCGIDWVRRTAESLARFEDGQQELLQLGLEREALNQRQGRLLASVLLPHQVQRLPPWDSSADPVPRPWDRNGQTRAKSNTAPPPATRPR